MKKSLMGLLNPRAWGASLIRSPSELPLEHSLEVYRQMPGGPRLVGRLSCEESEFVFRYDAEYDAEPISAFPEIEHEYRSPHLWPFFTVRIPPLDRDDVRREISNLSLEESQVIEILGSLAKVSVTSPYEFRIAGG